MIPIIDCPQFYSLPDGLFRVPVYISTANSGNTLRTYGIIDTGATEIIMPADHCRFLSLDFEKGEKCSFSTAGGGIIAYRHKCNFSVFNPLIFEAAHKIHAVDTALIFNEEDVKIAFALETKEVLLGVRNFLKYFRLSIDYSRMVFSLIPF